MKTKPRETALADMVNAMAFDTSPLAASIRRRLNDVSLNEPQLFTVEMEALGDALVKAARN